MSKYKKNDDCAYGKSALKKLHLKLQQLQAQLQLQQQQQEQLQVQVQAQVQAQAQAQNDTDNTSFNNFGNPVVNVHVNSNDSGNGSKEISAFRAIKTTLTELTPNFIFPVDFTSVEFDLNNEYDSNTSTFVAKTAGVYLFTASLIFIPSDDTVGYQFAMFLNVNGIEVDVDFDYMGINGFANAVDLSQIVRLNANDRVQIDAFSNIPGQIAFNITSSFAGVRISELSGENPPPSPPQPIRNNHH
jgi:hypothetical protein